MKKILLTLTILSSAATVFCMDRQQGMSQLPLLKDDEVALPVEIQNENEQGAEGKTLFPDTATQTAAVVAVLKEDKIPSDSGSESNSE